MFKSHVFIFICQSVYPVFFFTVSLLSICSFLIIHQGQPSIVYLLYYVNLSIIPVESTYSISVHCFFNSLRSYVHLSIHTILFIYSYFFSRHLSIFSSFCPFNKDICTLYNCIFTHFSYISPSFPFLSVRPGLRSMFIVPSLH